MKWILKEYFTYTRGERRGVLILFTLLLAQIVFYYLRDFHIGRSTADFSLYESEIEVFLKSDPIADKAPSTSKAKTHKTESKQPAIYQEFEAPAKESLFVFNPNDLSPEAWKMLGLNDRVIRTLKNYEGKGGKFYKKEDLKKIYGLKEEDYQRLESYIEIPKREWPSNFSKQGKKGYANKEKKVAPKPEALSIDINLADSASLVRLWGIGPVFSKRIIKYRTLLGGFIRKEQLREVYGIDKELYDKIEPFLKIESPLVSQININTSDYKALSKHPYINYKTGKAIANYRKQHGAFTKITELTKIYLISDTIYEKIAPYLMLQEPDSSATQRNEHLPVDSGLR